jgi:HlyD family secretion protein
MSDTKIRTSIIDDVKVKPFRAPGRKRQRNILLITLLVVTFLGAAAYFLLIPKEEQYVLRTYESEFVEKGEMIRTVQASGSVTIPVRLTVTAADVGENGYADKLYVNEGDAVDSGQVLAELSVPDLEDDLTDLGANLDDAERSLKQLVLQNKFSADKALRELQRLQEDITEAEEEVARQKKLLAVNSSRQSDLDAAEDILANLQDQYEEQQISIEEDAELNALEEEARQASIDRYRLQIARLTEDIDAATVRSPMQGEVLEIEDKLFVPGSSISKGLSLFTIADRSSAIVELEVLEQYAGYLSVGQEVALSVGGTAMKGTISNIGKIATMSSDGLGATVVVKVIPEEGADLLLGSTVVSELVLGTEQDVLTLPRGPYLTTGSQKYVYVVEDDTAVKRKVSYGSIESDKVQILGGLEAGEEVITSGYQNYFEFETITLGVLK